jgi:ABC-2 type transport system permease protein
MFSIFKKELAAFFNNATGYIVVAIFLLLNSMLLWVIAGQYNILESGYAHVDGLFYLAPWLFLLLCPAISMRMIAEEKQTGNWELLTTKPLANYQIVLGKYLASWVLVLVALLPCTLYYFTVWYIAEPLGNVDGGAFWGSFIGLLLLSGFYLAVGIYASSLSKNQIVAFVISVVLCFLCYYGFELLGSFFESAQLKQSLEELGIHAHYQSMSRGVIDSRDLMYFFISIGIFIVATVWKIKI